MTPPPTHDDSPSAPAEPAAPASTAWGPHTPSLVMAAIAAVLFAHSALAVFELGRVMDAGGLPADALARLAALRYQEIAITVAIVPALVLVIALVRRRALVRARVERDAGHDRHLASLGQMSATLAHEIRNPLTALKGHAQLLSEMTETGTKLHAKAERIVHEALRLEHLTNDLLTFARTGRLRRDETDLAILVHQTAASLPEGIVADCREGVAVARIDRVRVLQLLENLLRNALQHGTPPVEVTLASDAGTDYVEIRVRDHGKGIAPDRLEQVFEPFVTDATRGTGLGLAVVRRVAGLHGGTATASNHPAGGALFVVRLPR